MRMNLRFTVGAAAGLLLLAATEVSAQERCTNASLSGSYAFKVDGTVVSADGSVPFAAVGKNTYDGKGGLDGTIVISWNGAIIRTTYTGTYHVKADCTGSKSATLVGGPTVDFDFVIDDDAREIRMIVSDEGFAVSGSARKLVTDAKGKE